jgi:hypothetical protein
MSPQCYQRPQLIFLPAGLSGSRRVLILLRTADGLSGYVRCSVCSRRSMGSGNSYALLRRRTFTEQSHWRSSPSGILVNRSGDLRYITRKRNFMNSNLSMNLA